MPRRRCCGLVEQEPCYHYFMPADAKEPTVVTLLVEELEAMRLKNLAGMDQAACAKYHELPFKEWDQKHVCGGGNHNEQEHGGCCSH